MPDRGVIEINGIRLSYREQGTPQPEIPSILILHGLIASAETFNELTAHLPHRHIVSLDMPGSGQSDPSHVEHPTFATLAALVTQFAAQLSLGRPILVGHSHGGAISLRLAANSPAWPHALILLSPAHPFSRHELGLVRFYLSPPGRLFARSLPWLPKWLHLFAFRRMSGPRSRFTHQQLAPYLKTLRTPGTVSYMLRLLQTWEQDMHHLGRDLDRTPLSTPSLLLWGDSDIVVPFSTSSHLLRRLQSAKCVPLSGVGHLPNEESPEECAHVVETWLNGLQTRLKDPHSA